MAADHAIKNPADFSWLVNGFVERVPGVTHALLLSSDGFPLAASESVSSDGAETARGDRQRSAGSGSKQRGIIR